MNVSPDLKFETNESVLVEVSTGKNEHLSYTVLYGTIRLTTNEGKAEFKAGESFDILPNTKDYRLRVTRTQLRTNYNILFKHSTASSKPVELEWERMGMSGCDPSAGKTSETSLFGMNQRLTTSKILN